MYVPIVSKNHEVHIPRNNKCSILSPQRMKKKRKRGRKKLVLFSQIFYAKQCCLPCEKGNDGYVYSLNNCLALICGRRSTTNAMQEMQKNSEHVRTASHPDAGLFPRFRHQTSQHGLRVNFNGSFRNFILGSTNVEDNRLVVF